MTNSIAEIDDAELLFLIGTNTTEAHPVIGYKIRQAARRGAKLIVVDPRRIELAEEADHWLRIQPGTDIPFINGLMNIIIKEELYPKDFVDERTENFENLKKTVAEYTPERVSELTGIPVEDLYLAAREYAGTEKAMTFYTLGITEHVCGTSNVMSIANLAMLTEHIGKPSTGVNPLRGQNNVQGACDMGALPNVFTGYQPVTDPVARGKFENAWGLPLPGEIGLTIPDMFDKANEGQLKAMYILGENPVLTDPNSNHIRSGLEKIDFLVVHELFLTETAEYADVILPAASFAETDGTFTNTERRVQRVRKAIEAVPGKTNWQALTELCRRMSYDAGYGSAEEIFNEMAALTPSYAGINYGRIAADAWGKKVQDRRFARGYVFWDDNKWNVTFLPGQKSSMFRSLMNYNALVDLSAEHPPVKKGEEVPVILLTSRSTWGYNRDVKRKVGSCQKTGLVNLFQKLAK